MSSNQTNETKKLTSITRKLYFLGVRRRLRHYIFFDIFTPLLAFIILLADREYVLLGEINFDFCRRFSVSSKTLIYKVFDSNYKDILLRIDMTYEAKIIAGCISVIMLLQLISIIATAFRERWKIKKILAPINDMAMSINELTSIDFSEEKYHYIEDAIDNIDVSGENALSLSEQELKGIEQSINNLIRRMQENSRQQARFVNDASHELRTPIAVIEGYANMLKRWGRDDEKVLDEGINAIDAEVRHMKHLVEQLLFLARGDSGRTKIEREDISAAELMKEIYEESLMIDEKHIYRFKEWEENFILSADYGLIKQAVRILIDNAAKYSTESAEIILGYGIGEDGKKYLQVQDTGIGMSENDVTHVFERFYRSDEVRSYQGTGLGLAIAKWIVDKHNGHFEILSREELGTRIRIVFD